MKIVRQSEIAYVVKSSLGETTEWIAFPVKISTRSQSYSTSLHKARQIASSVLEIASKLETSTYKAMSPPKNGEFEHMQSRFEMWKDGKECISDAYMHSIMKFDSNAQLWEKMEMIAEHLDKLTDLAESFKSDKVVEVSVGTRFMGQK